MESVIEEQRRLMRRMMKHNGNLRMLWRKYAAAPLEDRYSISNHSWGGEWEEIL